MLREYRLTNFKAFGETVTIPIRPLTLIFGANSSGKSSIFQSMLLLKQTLEEEKNPNTVLLPKGSLVDLGKYYDFVHRHEIERNFEFGARFDLEIPLTLSPHESGLREAGLSIEFGRDVNGSVNSSYGHLTGGDNKQPIASYNVTLEEVKDGNVLSFAGFDEAQDSEFWASWKKGIDSYEDFNFLIKTNFSDSPSSGFALEEVLSREPRWRRYRMDREREKQEGISTEEIYSDFLSNSNIGWLLDRFDQADYYVGQNFLPRSYKYASSSPRLYKLAYSELVERWVTLPIERILSDFRVNLENLVYLGPLRSPPKRFYEYSGDTTDYVGQSGEHLPSLLFEDQELVEQIDNDLRQLGVKYQLKVRKFQHEGGSLLDVFSLNLVDTRTGVDASLRDVGFGISQVLPIVMQSRLSEKKTLLIEQPEIHLHPAHQAELGDLFIKSAKERGNTLLLETHSEHLLLRIMRRMRETSTGKLPEGAIAVRPEDVMVLFVESDGSQSIVREMPLNERGELVKAWPGGFFEEGLREIL